MHYSQNPLQQTFTWLCQRNNVPAAGHAGAAASMRPHVSRARTLYSRPIGQQLPYDNANFRAAYLLAYFPYYIEPLCHALNSADLPDTLFACNTLKVGLFGGGPCPELLGLAAYLRKRVPHLESVEATVFDRQAGWEVIQQGLVPTMLPCYGSPNTRITLNSKRCDVVGCLQRECRCGVADMDLIVAQNFLTEIFNDRKHAAATFERLIRRSNCRYLVFVENRYDQVREFMDELSGYLYRKGLTTARVAAQSACIEPGFALPDVLHNLFTREDGLIPRRYVKFHHMVLEIAR